MNTVGIKKIYESAVLPTYEHPGDAGADLYSNEDVIIHPDNYNTVGTGIALALPDGWVGLVHPRSGIASRMGVTVLNAPGTVDSGYRGEVKVILINHGSIPFIIRKGDRIAQLVFQKVETANFVEVQNLDETVRGGNGFGSSGGSYNG